jgi:hypothetical protein
MALLFDEDYIALQERGFSYVEDEQQRFFIFKDYPLPGGLYTVDTCDVLVVIPTNYNQDGNDMFWTNPRLHRSDGKTIPNTQNIGEVYNDNRNFQGIEYCRWSRHWLHGTPSMWRPGRDNIISIQRRIEWAFRNPDT